MGRSRTTMAYLVVVVICCMVVSSLQTSVFTVGEHRGWTMGVDYNAWAKDKNFKVGDLLVFDYSRAYSVAEVFEGDYKTCDIDFPIKIDKSGSTVVSLLNTGPRYFICGEPGCCDQGMKLFINVTA